MTANEKATICKAANMLKERTNESLLEIWEMTATMKPTPSNAILRGWIMTELERRFPESMDYFYDNCEQLEDTDLRKIISEIRK